jgi:small conductance mechanosensitive channel
MQISISAIANQYSEQSIDAIVKYSPRCLQALTILFLGFIFARLLSKLTSRYLLKANPIAQKFLSSIVFVTIFISASVVALSKIGFHTSSMVAVIGSIGIALGLAFQSSLSNISSGFMIIIFKPFKINDLVEIDGDVGNVKEISLFSTNLLNANNTTIVIPNSRVVSNKVTNFSNQQIRRIDIDFTIQYNQDFNLVKSIVMDIMLNDPRTIPYPAPSFVVLHFKDTGLVVSVRPWTALEHYWDLLYEMREIIKTKLSQNNIKLGHTCCSSKDFL